MAIDRDRVLQAATKFVDKKKYDKAILEYQKLIAADPNDARTLLKVGDLQSKMAAYPDAISTYETVGKLYAQQGFALKAIAVYKQIRELIAKHVPQLEERYGHIPPKLAELYQQLGLTSDALAALDEVATRLQRQQRDEEAIEIFKKIVELDPTNPLPHLRLAEALSRVKDVEGAVFEFKTAASQLAGLGRRDDAIKVLERLLHHRPDPEQAKICAELYLGRGAAPDGMQALAKLQICFQANPRDFDTLSLLARAFNAIGQQAKALEVQKEMARVARDAGKIDLFREITGRLMQIAPNDDVVRRFAGQTGSVSQAAPQMPPQQQHQPPQMHQQQMHQQQMQSQQAMQPAPYRAPQQQYQPPPPQQQQYQQPPQQQQHPYAARPQYPPPQHAPIAPPMSEDAGELQEEELVEEYAELEPDQVEEIDAQEAETYEDEQPEAPTYELADEPVPETDASGDYVDAAPDVVLEEGLAAAEELGEPPPDVSEQITQILADAQSFRRVRLYSKALETLRIGLEIEPRSMDLHEVYRDVLIEAGQTDEAVAEMLAIASLYIDALDGESAARSLQDVLAFDPSNGRAIQMLEELGYEVVDDSQEHAVPAPEDTGESGAYADAEAADLGAEVQAPLPSYDLDDNANANAAASYSEPPPTGREPDLQIDDPFAAGEKPLPSFEIEEPRGGKHAPAAAAPAAAVQRPTTSIAARAQDLEEALEESEFFVSRGLLEDARTILEDQLTRHPKHPLLRERLAEVVEQIEASRRSGSGTREKPKDGEDRSFDIAASLDVLDGLESSVVGANATGGFAQPDQQIDVEEVFAKFKEGVAKQVSPEDADTHYNLGIAYKEMGLVDDAIREFETAARDPKRECEYRSMIGMIEMERGRGAEAIEAFTKALGAREKKPDQETLLYYEIGNAYEERRMVKEALSYFQRTQRRDPNYRDVQERVRRLSKPTAQAPVRAAAVGADDEFDRAFDDLLKG